MKKEHQNLGASKNIKKARSRNTKSQLNQPKQPEQPIIKWGHETEITDISWLWKPLIPYGKVTLIEGAGGDGKSTLILTIAAMVSIGKTPPTLQDGELLPSESREPQTVFYLTNEDEVSDSSLKKFRRAGGDMTRFAYSGELQQYHVTMKEHELIRIIEETGAKLFIIDPFQAFLPPGVNINSINQMRPLFTMLSNVAKKSDCAIVLIGHLNKNEGGRDIYRGTGTADISSSVRSVLMIKEDKKKGRILEAIKCNFDEADRTEIRLILDSEKKLSFSVANDLDDENNATSFVVPYITKTEETASILKEMLAVKPIPISEIEKLLAERGISYRTGQRAREEIGAQMISINGVRHWKLPSCQVDNGTEQLDGKSVNAVENNIDKENFTDNINSE